MSQLKINKNNLAIERGERIRLARQLVSITRIKLSEKYGINTHTLRSWEKGANCISEKKANLLANIFKKEGLDISQDWILTGNNANYLELENAKIKEVINLQGDIKIFNEIEYFNNQVPKSITTLITDNALSPLFIKGDYVGGILADPHEYKELEGLCCIITLSTQQIISRKIISMSEKTAFVCSINPLAKLSTPDNEIVEFSNVALITRHWLLRNKSETS